MKLVARKPNWMEICFSGEDSYGNKSSRWASRSNPGDYLQFLDLNKILVHSLSMCTTNY